MIKDKAATIRELDRLDCEDDLLFFVSKFFKIRTGNDFIINHHHRLIVEALEMAVNGTLPNGCRNLIINMPPRYGKTELTVINFIAWCMARNPAAKFIHLSYGDKLVLDNSAQIRDLMKQAEYAELWPIEWRQDTDSKGLWRNQRGGGLLASPAGSGITGFGAGSTELRAYGKAFAGAIIIDDPLKPDDAFSDPERLRVNERLISTIQSRRNSRETPIILIMQRLHEDDMTGFIEAGNTGEKYHHLRLPALSDDGGALWEHKHTAAELRSLQESSPVMFAGQYQQRPEPKGGSIFLRDWWQPWIGRLPKFSYVFTSVDPAYTQKQENDPSAATVWGVWEDETGQPLVMLIYAWEGRLPLHELVITISDIAKGDPDRKVTKRGFPPSEMIMIENKASGISLSQELHRLFGFGGWSIQMYDPRSQDKVMRANVVSFLFAEGLVYARFNEDETGRIRPSASAEKVIEQAAKFPRSIHDDLVDTLTQALRHLRDNGYLLRQVEHAEIEHEKALYKKPELLPYDV